MNNSRNVTKNTESSVDDVASRFKARFGNAAPAAPRPSGIPRKATATQVKNVMEIPVHTNSIPEVVVENPPPEVVEPLLESTLESGLDTAIKKKRNSKGPREKKVLSDGRGYCSEGSVPYSQFRRKAHVLYKEATSGGSLGIFTKLIAPIWKSIPAEEKKEAHNNVEKYVSVEQLKNAYYNLSA